MAQSEIGVTLEKTVNHLVHSGIEMLGIYSKIREVFAFSGKFKGYC
jgi:hypothetical protein